MGTIAEKLRYMSNAVEDIQLAINQNHVEVDDTVELGLYGDKIREIANANGNNIKDFYIIEKFNGFSKMDMLPKNIEDVTDLVITGNLQDMDTLDCITVERMEGFSANTVTAKNIEDVTDNYQF